MCPRTWIRYGLFCLPRVWRRRLAARLRPWLLRQGVYRARCGEVNLALDFREHSALNFYAEGLIERPLRRVFLACLRPGMTVADVGSNMGYFALLAARRVGESGRVVAFEPVPANREFMTRNLALNPGIRNLTIEPLAVGDACGSMNLRLGWHEGNASLLSGARGTTTERIEVETTTLDAYCQAREIPRVDVIKMDIEGAEVLAIEGMADGLRQGRYGAMLMEWHAGDHRDLGSRPAAALAQLRACGYTLQRIHKRGVRPFVDADLQEPRIHLFAQPAAAAAVPEER